MDSVIHSWGRWGGGGGGNSKETISCSHMREAPTPFSLVFIHHTKAIEYQARSWFIHVYINFWAEKASLLTFTMSDTRDETKVLSRLTSEQARKSCSLNQTICYLELQGARLILTEGKTESPNCRTGVIYCENNTRFQNAREQRQTKTTESFRCFM